MADVSTAGWRTSIRSQSNGACVQVTVWRTSTRSQGNGACVEIAVVHDEAPHT